MGFTVVVLSALAIIITLALQSSYKKALDQASTSLDNIAGNNTEEILGKDVSVDLGEFVITEDEYGFIKSNLPVTVTNLTNEAKSFSIQLEAVATDGSRIKSDYVIANDLGAGQKQEFDAFSYVSSDDKEKMQRATFKIVSVSMS